MSHADGDMHLRRTYVAFAHCTLAWRCAAQSHLWNRAAMPQSLGPDLSLRKTREQHSLRTRHVTQRIVGADSRLHVCLQAARSLQSPITCRLWIKGNEWGAGEAGCGCMWWCGAALRCRVQEQRVGAGRRPLHRARCAPCQRKRQKTSRRAAAHGVRI